MNKTALIISVVLTTFMLMAVGGIVYAVRASETAQASADLSAGSIDPTLEQALSQRESQYQQMIAEANTRLEQSQQQQQALETQLAALQMNGQTTMASGSLTPEQAATIASDFLGNTSLYSVETVTVYGESIYKVTFSSGDIVYVSLSGQVVGSEAAPQVVAAQVTRPTRNAGHGEHEDGDDD
jgi:uncharacterized membrane protein